MKDCPADERGIHLPTNRRHDMVIVGLVLLVIGLVTAMQALVIAGVVLLVAGFIFNFAPGPWVGAGTGRRHYW